MTQVETVTLLRDGIAAARAGDKDRTRVLLSRVTDADPGNELAWLWRANAAGDADEAVECLRRVVDLNPTNQHACAALPDALIRAGAAAAHRGDKPTARELFAQATELSPRNETAWLWRAGVAETPEEAAEELEYVLSINPNNERAKQGLAHVRTLLEPQWACPLCEVAAAVPPEVAACPACRAVLTIAEPAAFDGPQPADRAVVELAARRLYAAYQALPSSETAYLLGLAYLNLGFPDEAVKALQTAVRGRPADPVWKSQVSLLVQHRLRRPAVAAVAAPVVLVADDSPTIRKLVAVTLGGAGYRVAEAADGHEVADRIGEVGVPVLFILDVMMPGLDGFQVCKMLRHNPDTAKVPVVFLTGKDGFLNKLRGQWAGAAEYLTKPFDPQRLLACVGKLVPLGGK